MRKKIPLELHHINGNHNDNRLENLQILCSNCHSLAHEYSNSNNKSKNVVNTTLLEKCLSGGNNAERQKKEKEKNIRYCKHCGKKLKSNQKNYCSQNCAHAHVAKIPSKNELVNKLNEFNWNKTKTGKYFDVSGNSVNKWIKKYNIIK